MYIAIGLFGMALTVVCGLFLLFGSAMDKQSIPYITPAFIGFLAGISIIYIVSLYENQCEKEEGGSK